MEASLPLVTKGHKRPGKKSRDEEEKYCFYSQITEEIEEKDIVCRLNISEGYEGMADMYSSFKVTNSYFWYLLTSKGKYLHIFEDGAQQL